MHDTPDTITSADLPRLRADMLGYAENEVFGDDFHAACLAVIAAIDQARDDDEVTHARLEASLNAFVAAGQDELRRCARIVALCNRLADAEESSDFTNALVALVPLLPWRLVLEVGNAVAAAMCAEACPDQGPAPMPVASNYLH